VIAASIRSYLDRELGMVNTEEGGYELRYEETVLATLGNPRIQAEVECVTRDGTWRFVQLRNAHAEAMLGTAVVATYRSRALPGGTIVLGDDTKLRLRPPIVGDTWRLRRGRRDTLLEMRSGKHEWRLRFGHTARELHELPLVTMFAFHGAAMEMARSPEGGAVIPGGY
jgi:hypothetical protein